MFVRNPAFNSTQKPKRLQLSEPIMTPTYVLADDGKLLIYTILSIRIPGEYLFSAQNSIKKKKRNCSPCCLYTCFKVKWSIETAI